MTTEQKKNYKKCDTKDKHCKNEETIGKEPGQPGFLVHKSIPKKEKAYIYKLIYITAFSRLAFRHHLIIQLNISIILSDGLKLWFYNSIETQN